MNKEHIVSGNTHSKEQYCAQNNVLFDNNSQNTGYVKNFVV